MASNPAGWLYRITRRQVRDFRRRSWVKHIFTRRRVEDPDALESSAGGPAAALERKEDQRVLLAILAKIREERRTTFVLFEIEGLSGEEIARIQSVPLNTVWTRLYHARKDFGALAAKFREAQLRARGHGGRREGHEDERRDFESRGSAPSAGIPAARRRSAADPWTVGLLQLDGPLQIAARAKAARAAEPRPVERSSGAARPAAGDRARRADRLWRLRQRGDRAVAWLDWARV